MLARIAGASCAAGVVVLGQEPERLTGTHVLQVDDCCRSKKPLRGGGRRLLGPQYCPLYCPLYWCQVQEKAASVLQAESTGQGTNSLCVDYCRSLEELSASRALECWIEVLLLQKGEEVAQRRSIFFWTVSYFFSEADRTSCCTGASNSSAASYFWLVSFASHVHSVSDGGAFARPC